MIEDFFAATAALGFSIWPRIRTTTYRSGMSDSTLDYFMLDQRVVVCGDATNPSTRYYPKFSHLALSL
jgi:hypothetical protein